VKPASGYLSLDSAPWANVSMAGRSLGTTPLVRVALPPGHYVLKLENPEIGRSTSYTVDIQPGRNTSRFVGWGSE
jgi:serine/threonine-protein kinase